MSGGRSESPRRSEHDVVVVGASVAGCRTTLTLAERGVRVLLLDKAEFPRWKPCAGGLTLKTRPYIPDPLFDLVECEMRGAYLTFGDNDVTHVRSNDPVGWMVHRESFDQAHLNLVESCPTVDVALGTAVRTITEDASEVFVETDNGEYRATVVVGADGSKSIVSRFLPGHEDRTLAFAYEGEGREAGPEAGERGRHPLPADHAHFDFRMFPGGYGWVFPKRDHLSIGGYVYGGSMPEIKKRYAEFCGENVFLQGVETYRTRGHPISLGGGMRSVHTRRVLLVGDAAGLVDPLTGEGIYYALRSGHLAGEAVTRFLREGEPLDSYGRRVRSEIQEQLRYAKILAHWIYRYPRASFRLLFKNPLICQWLTQIGSGRMTYKDLIRTVLKRGLILPFQTRWSREVEVDLPGAESSS